MKRLLIVFLLLSSSAYAQVIVTEVNEVNNPKSDVTVFCNFTKYNTPWIIINSPERTINIYCDSYIKSKIADGYCKALGKIDVINKAQAVNP